METQGVPLLYIAPWVDLGGSDRGTVDWFKNIDRERWAPSLITTSPSPNRWLHQVEPHAEEVWNLPDLMPGARFPEFILGFIESRGVRLVHIMNSRLAFDLLPDIASLAEPPAVVVQLHAEEPNQTGYVRYVTRRYGNLVDAFSVVSHDLKKTIADYEIPPSRIEVIYLGVDGEGEFNPDAVAPLAGSENGLKRVLWPGRLVDQKDPLLTLEVVARARELGASFVLDIVGDGGLKDTILERASAMGLADHIRFHPPSKEMARWYRSSDLVLMTSRYEGVPLVIYEALAMGVPVIAPALPGNVELMNGEGGLLIDPRDDVDGYARGIVTLLRDGERRRRLGQTARERMVSDFSLAGMGRGHDRLYERLLERRSHDLPKGTASSGAPEPDRSAAPVPEPQLRLPRRPPPSRTVGAIVPCYRHGLFLEGCVESIKAQTHPPASIVVVDDCSDDEETVRALERLDADPDVAVIRQPFNSGPSAARNRAIRELDCSYFLPLDADDELLPDALERMLAQLEAAPENVGFVYPCARHFGNRQDEFRPPAWNVWLLMQQNYCAAPALFDRRLFADSGVEYPEDVVVGHEDWDLILQLAERGIEGVPAEQPTFRYRKQGFSRAVASDNGPLDFSRTVELRHPRLYGDRDRLKTTWAPAVSVLLCEEGEAVWSAEELSAFQQQTCGDFELLASTDLGAAARAVTASEDRPDEWLRRALDAARGRYVLLLPRSARSILTPQFVEQLIRAFTANPSTTGIVLAGAPAIERVRFSQLDDLERLSAEPVAVAFERPLWTRLPELTLRSGEPVVAELALALQGFGPVQWRLIEPVGASALGSAAERPGLRLDLNLAEPSAGPEAMMRHMVAHQPPRLPGLAPGTIRRWEDLDSWVPPYSQLLFRHLDLATGWRMVTTSKEPPEGYVLEHVLGSTKLVSAPGTVRLVHGDHSFRVTEGDDLQDGSDFGLVENQPLPELVGVELRRVPSTGQETLVAGSSDPLLYDSEHVSTLGWIEPFPLLPRSGEHLHVGPWGVEPLHRRVDRSDWAHSYSAGLAGPGGESVIVGSVQRHRTPNLIALRLGSDGRLASELCAPGRPSRNPAKLARWLAEPLLFASTRTSRLGGTLTRLRHLPRHRRARRPADDEGIVLGYIRRENQRGSRTLYSTVHPVTGDQLATTRLELAQAWGYLLDGILGSIFEVGAGEARAQTSGSPAWARLPRPQGAADA